MLVYEDEASEIEGGEVGANTEEFLAGVGKIVRRIEEKGARVVEEPEEITEYGVVVYTVSSRIVEYMLEQVDLYDKVLSGELPIDQALELVKKSHAEALEILKADMKPTTKKSSRKKAKKKTTKKSKSKSKKKTKKSSSKTSG